MSSLMRGEHLGHMASAKRILRPLAVMEMDILEMVSEDDDEHELKNRTHAKLLAKFTADQDTGCMLWTGAWHKNGQGIIRVGASVQSVIRAAAWVFLEGFQLRGENVAIHTCDNLACFNWEHIKVFPDWALASVYQQAVLEKKGWLGRRRKKMQVKDLLGR